MKGKKKEPRIVKTERRKVADILTLSGEEPVSSRELVLAQNLNL